MSGYPQGPYGGPPQQPPGQVPPGQLPQQQFPQGQVPMGQYPAGPYAPAPGQYPAGYGQPGMMQMPRTSAAAVTSLILSLVVCLPGVHSLAAIVCGFVGIRATGNPMVRGRGMAVAGLIIGIVGVLGWSGCGGAMVYTWHIQQKSAPARTLATTFIQDLSAGKNKEAKALVEPGTDTKAFDAFGTSIQSLGPITQMIPIAIPNMTSATNSTSQPVTMVSLTIQTQSAQRQAVIEVVDHSDGTQGIVHWQLNP